MLRELRIHNIAIVEDICLNFADGLTILTGETGAGKSVIASALGLLAGSVNPGGLVRSGEELGYAEGLFDLHDSPVSRQSLMEMGVRLEGDDLLVLRRELRSSGRDRVLINGLTSSLALLKRVGALLLSIQSQDQQRQLTLPFFACDLMDSCLHHKELLAEFSALRHQFLARVAELDDKIRELELGKEQLDIWQYQLREIRAAGLDLEEEALLAEQIHFGRNARHLLETAGSARALLDDADPSVRTLLGQIIGDLSKISAGSNRLNTVGELLESAAMNLGEASQFLERYLDTCEVDPAQIDELEQRKALYEDLERKYSRDVAGLLALQESLAEKISQQENSQETTQELQAAVLESRQQLTDLAGTLHAKREAGGKKLAPRLEEILRPLGLPTLEVEFQVQLQESENGVIPLADTMCNLSERGCDTVELLVRTNPGEGLGPVARIASGGEKSRIFLGLTVLSSVEVEPPLLLFDEIDTGLGMEGAAPVADLLQSLARQGQVVCITHLATVAARGRHHLKVGKRVVGNRTITQVMTLNQATRVNELSRLLGGEAASDSDGHQVAFARKLLFPGETSGEQ